MTIDERGRVAGRRTVATFEASTNVAQDYDRLVVRRRAQRRNRTFALAAAVVVAVFAVLFVQSNLAANSTPQPMEPVPGIDIGDVPVWYDDAGLHRGDVVEQTPVKLVLKAKKGEDPRAGVLALVRTGAVYSDPATGDVWFHPWGGEPRIVGHDSVAGPGGDPNGDIAAWWDNGDLVLYDTAAGRELSRTPVMAAPARCQPFCMEHFRGNGILQVSSDRVVWQALPMGNYTDIFDVQTGDSSDFTGTVLDVHDDAWLYYGAKRVPGGRLPDSLILKEPGQAGERHPELATRGRFSPSGAYVLSVYADSARKSGAAILNTGTGEVWHVPHSGWPWLAWSYGDIALVETQIWSSGNYRAGGLLACDASRDTCETLPAESPFLVPTN